MAYPICDDKTKKVSQILFFKDTELQNEFKSLENLDRPTYLGFLENDYYDRVKEEYAAEVGLFGRVDTPMNHKQIAGSTQS